MAHESTYLRILASRRRRRLVASSMLFFRVALGSPRQRWKRLAHRPTTGPSAAPASIPHSAADLGSPPSPGRSISQREGHQHGRRGEGQPALLGRSGNRLLPLRRPHPRRTSRAARRWCSGPRPLRSGKPAFAGSRLPYLVRTRPKRDIAGAERRRSGPATRHPENDGDKLGARLIRSGRSSIKICPSGSRRRHTSLHVGDVDAGAEVPHELKAVGRLTDMVQTKYVVVDDPFHQVETAPADKHASEQPTARPSVTPADRSVQQEKTNRGGDPRGRVEEAVESRRARAESDPSARQPSR